MDTLHQRFPARRNVTMAVNGSLTDSAWKNRALTILQVGSDSKTL